jgi:hypothetical protein
MKVRILIVAGFVIGTLMLGSAVVSAAVQTTNGVTKQLQIAHS